MLVIGISGKQGSGKTTLAGELAQELKAKTMKFADPLYLMQERIKDVMQVFGHDIKTPDGNLLQLLGTEWGRKTLGENVWADLLAARLRAYNDEFPVIVDDVRFPNEFDVLKGAGAFLVRLEAGETVRRARAEKWRDNTAHRSEIALDGHIAKFDLVVSTDILNREDTLKAVHFKLDQFLRERQANAQAIREA